MKTTVKRFAAALLLARVGSTLAGVHCVDVNSTNATPPYLSWPTAATIIQDAVDAAVPGDEIVVTNGIYAPVSVDKRLNIRSVNGPQSATIDGLGHYRCAFLTSDASLSGFTLAYGHVLDDSGGGGGAYGGTLNNCTLTGNTASATASHVNAYGGGAYECVLKNCTLTGNSAYRASGSGRFGGGAAYGTLNNCIVFANNASSGPGYGPDVYQCQLSRIFGGDPLFVDRASGNLRLQSNSPCINAGNNSSAPSATDLDGNPRIVGGTVDIGAYEYQALDLINSGVVSNRFGFNVTGQSNWVIVLEASGDFMNWTALTTNTLSSSPFPFRDPTPPSFRRRFYRARQEPP